MDGQPFHHPAGDPGADRRQKQCEPEPVGEKAGRQQQDAGYKDHDPIGHGTDRHGVSRHLLPRPSQRPQTLASGQCAAQKCGHDDDRQGGDQTDLTTDLDEQRDLDNRNENKGEEQNGHGISLLLAGGQPIWMEGGRCRRGVLPTIDDWRVGRVQQ